MIFTEARFAIFFAIVFLVRLALPGNTSRKVWLLASSYAFYAAWDWRFLSLILLSTAVDYCVGRALNHPSFAARRRILLLVSLVTNLGLLGAFKYLNFFVDSAVGFSDPAFVVCGDRLFSLLHAAITFQQQRLGFGVLLLSCQAPAEDTLGVEQSPIIRVLFVPDD